MDNRQRLIAVFIAAVAVAALTVAVSAAIPNDGVPNVDDETANTTTTSQLTNKSVITYNATTNANLSFNITNADGSNMSVEVLQGGTLLESFDNSSAEMSFDGNFSDLSSNFVKYYNFTLTDDESGYTGVVADAGENVTLEYRIINDTSLSNRGITNVTIFWNNHANKSFTRFDASEVTTASLGTIPQLTSGLPLFGDNISVGPAKAERADVGVNGIDQETVTVHVADTDAKDALDVTHQGAGETGISWMGTATVDGTPVPIVASGESGPAWLDTGNETYATVTDAGDEVVVHNTGNVLSSSTSNITVSVVGAEAAGFRYARSLAADYGASAFQQFGAALSAGPDLNGDPGFATS